MRTVFALYGQRCSLCMAIGVRSVWSMVFAQYDQRCFFCMANGVFSVWSMVFVLCGQRCSLRMVNGVRSLWPTVFAPYGHWCSFCKVNGVSNGNSCNQPMLPQDQMSSIYPKCSWLAFCLQSKSQLIPGNDMESYIWG